MDIGIPLRELGAIDVEPLRATILALSPDQWLLDQRRQKDYDVHRRTESVVMVFTDGSGWPAITVSRESGWDMLAETAVPLMQDIIARHYTPGGTIIRAMAAKLLPGEVIIPHRDTHPSFAYGHRIHVPITSNSRVRFMIDGRPYRFELGQAYEINNQLTHSVMNKGAESRITFIFDYVPGEKIDRSA